MLVLSADALAAALLGALIETEGHRVAFTNGGESARDALRRVRPAVILLDCEYPDACSSAVIGPAKMMGAGVLLFARPQLDRELHECAERYGVAALLMPAARGELRAALERAARQLHGR